MEENIPLLKQRPILFNNFYLMTWLGSSELTELTVTCIKKNNKLQKLTYVNQEDNYTNIYLKRLANTLPISLRVFFKKKKYPNLTNMLSEEQRKPLIRVYEAIIQSPHSAIAINEIILVKKNYGTLLQYKEKKKKY